MKTTILEELNLPEERVEALRREAVRRGVPVSLLIRECVLETSDRINAAAGAMPRQAKSAA